MAATTFEISKRRSAGEISYTINVGGSDPESEAVQELLLANGFRAESYRPWSRAGLDETTMRTLTDTLLAAGLLFGSPRPMNAGNARDQLQRINRPTGRFAFWGVDVDQLTSMRSATVAIVSQDGHETIADVTLVPAAS